MSGTILNGVFPLPKSYLPKRDALDWEESLKGLRELVDDPEVGAAARTALRVVEQRDGDPRLCLLIIEAAQEGFFERTPRTVQPDPKGPAPSPTKGTDRSA